MPAKTSKDMGLRIDNTSTLVDITAYTNSQSLQSAIKDLDTSPLGAANRTRVLGMANVTVPINFFVNTTTDAIFGKCINGTSVSKTVEFKSYTGRYYNGEVWPTAVQFSGSSDNLQVGSATLVFTGLVNRTSVALA